MRKIPDTLTALMAAFAVGFAITPAYAQHAHGSGAGPRAAAGSNSTSTSTATSGAQATTQQTASPTNTIQQGNTFVQAPQIPVATAIGPALAGLASGQCVLSKTASGGLQLMTVGVSLGMGETEPYKECNAREAIKILATLPADFIIGGYRADQLLSTIIATQLASVRETLDAWNKPMAQATPRTAPLAPAPRPAFNGAAYRSGSDCVAAAMAAGLSPGAEISAACAGKG